MRLLAFIERLNSLRTDRRGAVAAWFALAVVPAVLAIGAAVDYSRVNQTSVQLQAAVDMAALQSSGLSASAAQAQVASFVQASMSATGATLSTPVVSKPTSSSLKVSVTASIPTRVLNAFISSMNVTKSATAGAGTTTATAIDNSCILTLGENLTINTDTMTFNGSPSVNLTGCNLRSNQSMDCNGHSTGADTYAAGSITGCSNPHPGQSKVTDIWANVAQTTIDQPGGKQCGSNAGGYSWTSNGNTPSAVNNKVILVSQTNYNEVHICGDLTLNGSSGSTLTGPAPSTDTVVIIENGGIVVPSNANVTALRTTFVLAGGSGSPIVSWPNGNGQSANFSVSASINPNNPWKGIAIYENPSLNYDMTWGPGANFSLDGIFYFPNASFTVHGNMNSGSVGCAKIVVGEFLLNGTVNLAQSSTGCALLQVAQPQVTMPVTTPPILTQ